jgi:prepilin-type N-terminal cleavage/methylation domain-containing protein
MKNYLDALKRRKEETGESGFSLIELIVVVVILGVLAAIAVPVFLGLQAQAEQSAQDSVAANAASQVASNLAQGAAADANIDNLEEGTITITVAVGPTAPSGATLGIDNFCVTASGGAANASTSGPGCS